MLNGMEFVANTKQICYNRECEFGREGGRERERERERERDYVKLCNETTPKDRSTVGSLVYI
jgi:hypothetical protein